MKTYELTYIISSSLTGPESDELKKNLEAFITEKGGTVLKSEKTIAQPLAYLMKKQSSGYFVILTFQSAEDKIKEIKENLERNDKVLRHLVVVKKPLKEMKARRTRKPITPAPVSETKDKVKKSEGTAELEEINKKLDEILS